jgi:hypothetical protein
MPVDNAEGRDGLRAQSHFNARRAVKPAPSISQACGEYMG